VYDILLWTTYDITDILDLNAFIDYSNPEEFILSELHLWHIYIAKQNHTHVVWFCLIQYIWWNTPLISLIKIYPDFQKQWIGTKFIEKLKERFRIEWYLFFLASTMKENTISQKFLERNGWKNIWILDMPHGKELFYQYDLDI
jgi:ribosomal protein S18 acetylase RimI-like enzyme